MQIDALDLVVELHSVKRGLQASPFADLLAINSLRSFNRVQGLSCHVHHMEEVWEVQKVYYHCCCCYFFVVIKSLGGIGTNYPTKVCFKAQRVFIVNLQDHSPKGSSHQHRESNSYLYGIWIIPNQLQQSSLVVVVVVVIIIIIIWTIQPSQNQCLVGSICWICVLL